jgi:hypothetical protein
MLITQTCFSSEEKFRESLKRSMSPAWRQMLRALRPGLKPPCGSVMGTTILTKLFDQEREKWFKEMENTWVSMSLDGWTGPSGAPVLGVCLGDQLYQAVETVGDAHTAEFLAGVTEKCLKEVSDLSVKVASFVTHHTTAF